MNTIGAILRGAGRPLKSRKVRTAIVGAVVSLAARYGLDVEPAAVAGIVALFASVILGVAIEDNGRHAAKRLLDPRLFLSPSKPDGTNGSKVD